MLKPFVLLYLSAQARDLLARYFARRPGLAQAMDARVEVKRTPPPAPRVIGGVDEPGLAPLRKGERTYPLIVRTPIGPVPTLHQLFKKPTPAAKKARKRVLCDALELMN